MPVSEETYRRVALEDPDGHWELVCGRLRQKPDMTTEHGDTLRELIRQLIVQLDSGTYSVGMESPKLRVSTGSYYIPDVCVIPRTLIRRLRERPGTFEVYEEPMPLVVEAWSPSTGTYDVEAKLREYQWRKDQEIWRLHPYEHTLTAWRLQPDGSYTETVYRSGVVEPASLPGVRIALDELFM